MIAKCQKITIDFFLYISITTTNQKVTIPHNTLDTLHQPAINPKRDRFSVNPRAPRAPRTRLTTPTTKKKSLKRRSVHATAQCPSCALSGSRSSGPEQSARGARNSIFEFKALGRAHPYIRGGQWGSRCHCHGTFSSVANFFIIFGDLSPTCVRAVSHARQDVCSVVYVERRVVATFGRTRSEGYVDEFKWH